MTIVVKVPCSGAYSVKATIRQTEEPPKTEYIRIDTSFLKHLHKSFVRFSNKNLVFPISGGFIDSCTNSSVFLRVPAKKDTFEVPFDSETVFEIKETEPNYISLVELKVQVSKYEYLTKVVQEKEQRLQQRLDELEKAQKYLSKKNIVVKI